jgi:hypothetical protein
MYHARRSTISSERTRCRARAGRRTPEAIQAWYPDTAAFERTLQRIAAQGTSEALAAPITS